ncbi:MULTISPECIES: pyridoxal-phosphate dependent enzyme [Roseobacteraceae]|uniref:Diaminopropionate ammonia-lyase n=1 Tax=Pseudosulfitobacter pseudonitzschiae TaxID=1402135 RepID=A0A221JXG2_9RHOB|nr:MULTISPECIES: pyridoxal-phosphate dependent enzyme [Roseobacteraceae]ASM71406.1 diaminopropionate ammonia-lyase [Pseudosulfitobacter pseudonitzschiae]
MEILSNTPRRLVDLPSDVPAPSVDAARAALLVAQCPVAAATPLVAAPALAALAGIGILHIKDERNRMGLGSFKALGAAYVIACDAADGTARGCTYVTASAGNHGMSVAAGAAAFGARAVVYIAETVPEAFAARLRDIGAEVRREGEFYEDSMAAATCAADTEGFALLSDSSWPGYYDRPHRLMEGYLALMDEAIRQIPQPPTHLFLQAGVGGLAGACAALARKAWGAAVQIVVVEPDAAPALYASVSAGIAMTTHGPVSAMGRLDCKEPSLIALKGLARDADAFVLISEDEGAVGAAACAAHGLSSTPSGAAGIAGLIASAQALGLGAEARVLCILSEGPE